MPRARFTKIAMWQTSKSSVEESGWSIRRKRRVSSAIERERTRLLDGHRDKHAWGYGFQGQVTAGDGPDKQGKMGAGYNNLRRTKKKQ